MSERKTNPYLIRLFLLALPIAFFYQNCGKINVNARLASVQSGSLASNSSRGTVPIPKPASGDLRAVFFIDNSDSMISGSCVGTVDWDVLVTKPPPVSCGGSPQPISGVDHDLKRVKIIRQWIQDIETSYTDRPDLLAKVKMIILPFSGGTPQVGLNSIIGSMLASKGFASIAETKKVLNRIESMQNKIDGKPTSDPVIGAMGEATLRSYFGTSVPRPTILSSMVALKSELELLKDSGGRIEYVFLSDGVPKPRGIHVEQAAVQIWGSLTEVKPTGRSAQPPGIPAYAPPSDDPAQIGCLEQEYETVGYDQCTNATCRKAVRDWADLGSITTAQRTQCGECIDSLARISGAPFFDAILSSWGNPMDNTTDAIFHSLGKVKTLQDQYPDVSFRFNFLRLDTLSPANFATPAEERSKDLNWLVKAKDIYKSGHRTIDVLTPEVDFSLFPGLSKNETYKLESIVALNINARLNSVGKLDIDSDGDGLFDSEERQLNTNPYNARTNGVCLDSIVQKMGGCITMGCSPEIDRDADGLNECEEKTLGTSDSDFDTDGDGIPDAMEVLYGYNPTVSDLKVNSSSDEIDNYDQWKMGVPPSVNVDSVPSELLTQVIAEPQGQKSVIDSFNRTIVVPEYLFKIQNMRTANVGASTDTPMTFMSKTKKASTAVLPRIIGGIHPAGVNRIVIIGKVVSVQNVGDVYWVGKVIDVPYEKDGQQISINFDDLKPLQALDPQEGQ